MRRMAHRGGRYSVYSRLLAGLLLGLGVSVMAAGTARAIEPSAIEQDLDTEARGHWSASKRRWRS